MASDVIERKWRPSLPRGIERDLADLWSEIGREGPVTRALMANLVVVCDMPAGAPLDVDAASGQVPIEEVGRRHPSRVILLQHASNPAGPRAPEAAAIGVLVFGPPQARYGIEQIAIRSTCADASLPSIVRHLTLGDVPTSLWWTGELSPATLVDTLAALGRQLVYDSRTWQDFRKGVLALASTLAQPRAPHLADLNWRRLLPLRQVLVSAMAASASVTHTPAIHVRHRPGEDALGWLLIGWLAAKGVIDGVSERAVREDPEAEDVLTVTFGGTPITAALNDARVQATYRPNAAPLVVAVPRETIPEAVAAELRTLQHDACLHESILALARLLAPDF